MGGVVLIIYGRKSHKRWIKINWTSNSLASHFEDTFGFSTITCELIKTACVCVFFLFVCLFCLFCFYRETSSSTTFSLKRNNKQAAKGSSTNWVCTTWAHSDSGTSLDILKVLARDENDTNRYKLASLGRSEIKKCLMPKGDHSVSESTATGQS